MVGMLRSAYTFVKTTFWLGGWSFFRAPLALVLAYGALLLGGVATAHRRLAPRRLNAHRAAVATAVLGFCLFAYANRRFFGGWGGVGGWYVWSWYPWLAIAVHELFDFGRRVGRVLLVFAAAFVLSANTVYYLVAYRLYR